MAHHSGPWTDDAFNVLKRYDRVVAQIRDVAARKAPRPYEIVLLSDHGQSFGATFKQRYGFTLEEVISGFLRTSATAVRVTDSQAARRPGRDLAREMGGVERRMAAEGVRTATLARTRRVLEKPGEEVKLGEGTERETQPPHTQADDVEVGGQRGREALDRLRNVVGRVESSWRPASAEEGFEIVRRRLFEPIADPAQFKDRDVVARAFADLYRTQQQEFPPECRDADYEKRIRATYPIHPEIFDRLYGDWSTLAKFQRTRGVLRLMAAVIHSRWEKGDRNPMILPASIPIDDPRVQFELTRYLPDNWVPVIEKDVDGPGSLPLRLDGEVPNPVSSTHLTLPTIHSV